MTASRAHRRGPSPSLARDAHAPARDVQAPGHEGRAEARADDHAPAPDRRRAAEAATVPVPPMTPVTPVAPVTSTARAASTVPMGETRLLRTTVPAHSSRAAGVRSMLAEHLAEAPSPCERLDNAVLAANELFVNAVEHGSPDRGDMITVTFECTERELRVTVADRSPALPRLRTADDAEESGRGLAIVAALTDDWGIAPPDPGTPGKKVWFTLALQGMS